jgi:hypothetical protein
MPCDACLVQHGVGGTDDDPAAMLLSVFGTPDRSFLHNM